MKLSVLKIPRFLRSRLVIFMFIAGALGVTVVVILMREMASGPAPVLMTTQQSNSAAMVDGEVRFSGNMTTDEPAMQVTQRRTSGGIPPTRAPQVEVATNRPIRDTDEEAPPPPPPPIAINLYTTSSWEPEPEPEPASEVIARQRAQLILAASEPQGQEPPEYAPFGRMIRCQLVNTVDSTDGGAPIIGLVTEPVYWNGKLIVPANSEVHGKALVDRERERILSERDWVIVMHAEEGMQPGRELRVRGTVLDGDDRSIQHGGRATWGITDGSLGIKGMTISDTGDEEIKLFASAFMQGLADGLIERAQMGDGGAVVGIPTVRNAALGGTSSVLAEYAGMIRSEIERNGFYTRVPGGKQFILYVEDVLLPEQSTVGVSARERMEAQAEENAPQFPNPLSPSLPLP